GILGGGGWSSLLDEAEDVLLGDTPAAAGALHLSGVDTVLGGDPRHDRRDEALAVGRAVPGGRGSCRRRLRHRLRRRRFALGSRGGGGFGGGLRGRRRRGFLGRSRFGGFGRP